MPLNLASPGIIVREVDLTSGRVDPTSDATAALVAPFEKGPVETAVVVSNEQELLTNYGKPYTVGNHYEGWFAGSSFLAYGGNLLVLRSDGSNLKNAFVGTASSIKIKSYDDYVNKGYDETSISNVTFAARNPGSWANGIKVAIIDAKSDQILTGITTLGGLYTPRVGYGVTQSVEGRVNIGAGTTSVLTGFIKGVITGVSTNQVEVKVLSHVSSAGVETPVDYQPQGLWRFSSSGSVAIHTNGQNVAWGSTVYTSAPDWFDNQSISLNNVSIPWNSVANRPTTSRFAAARGSRFDEIHVVALDGNGSITGNEGTILEKHLSLSKAKNAVYSAGSPSYWNKYIGEGSSYIFAGSQPVGVVTCGLSTSSFDLVSNGSWNKNTANNLVFDGIGSLTYTLSGGANYNGGTSLDESGALSTTLTDISSGYDLLTNTEEYDVDFILMGSASYEKEVAQAIASKIIAVAQERQDCLAFVSPYKGSMLLESGTSSFTPINSATITENIIGFYSPIPSSSYAIFDSGYKYMYDKFSGTFRYIPLNGDIAGLCARNDVQAFPWSSPAGTTRGAILNAVKLAYNPSKLQRDRLYSNRINPVIFSPGSGIILFGDKTGLAKASAFDRINVRRLFIYIENAVSAAGRDQLFEFNDDVTRSNFVNIVDPFLRAIQARGGIIDYRVVCDESNNTASVIDSNELVADIYIKPARSINFIGLTFVATRTGVSFEEIIGSAV